MAGKERPVLVALITTMGVVIAALITSGVLQQREKGNLEKRVQSLEAQLSEERAAAPDLDHDIRKPPANAAPTAAGNLEPPRQPRLSLSDSAANLAQAERAQILPSGGSAKGALAEGTIKSYVFVGDANTPLLFILDQPANHFDVLVSVLDSRGTTLLRDVRWYGNNNQISFTPPASGAYLLRMTGTHGFGNFVVVLRPLEGESS